jgi:galactofuranose transport system substrate-binding protein
MKRTFKFASLLIIFAMLLSFSAFAGGDSEEEDDGQIVVGFSQIGAESAWRVANTESIKSEAENRPNIDLKFADAQQKQENQIKAIRSFIAQKVDVIAFAPIVESGYGPVMEEAKAAGIPVILVDRHVDLTDDSLWVSFMGSNFYEEGVKTGEWLVENYERIKRPDKSMDTINIVELQGTVGSAPATDRMDGFLDAIADHPEFQVIRTQTGEFTRAKGKEVMEAFLKAEGDNIDVLFAHNDDMALGAIQAIEDYGLKPGVDIIIVSIDAVRGAFEAMIEGKLNCTVECSPLLGPQLFDAVEALMRGETLPKTIWSNEGVFPQEIAEETLPTRTY